MLEILDGISKTLVAAFPGYMIFGDQRVRQGLKTPSFFVGLGEYSTRPLPGGLTELKQHAEVIYFPENRGDYQTLWNLGSRVLTCLEKIPLGDGSLARGQSRRCMINDDLLHIHATYRLRVKSTEQSALMGSMRRQTRLS